MIRNSIIKIVCLLLIVGLNWAGLLAVIETVAYFNDTENAPQNIFSAAILDFSVTNGHIEGFIGMEALSDIEFASVVTKKTGSLNIQYEVNAEKIGGDDDFCNALTMEVEHNGVEKHDGSLLSLSTAATTLWGTWEFEIELPASATNIPHGAECNVDLVFKGWRSDVATFEESGFTDEERIELRLTSRMIVLNEFLPNPDPSAHGLDFGDDADAMPKGEWVELYNNSDFAFDLSGYYLTDADGNRIDVEGCRTNTSGTIIPSKGPSKGFLVVYRKGGEDCTSHDFTLNNDGDTVKLFDNNNRLVDSYTYTSHDYCNLEPTPGDENSDITGDGTCEEVPPNKSYARIPDGIGFWVDPIPTPGGPNKIDETDFNEDVNGGVGEQSAEPENDLNEEIIEIGEEEMEISEIEFSEIELPQIEFSQIELPQIELPEIDVLETTTPLIEGIIPIEMEEDSPLPIEEEEVVEEEIIEETIEEQPGDEEEPVEVPEVIEVEDSGDDGGDDEGDEEGDGASGGENAGGEGSESDNGEEPAVEGGVDEL